MNVTIKKSLIDGTVTALSSKSVLHRLLILASFATSETKIVCNNYGKDIERTVDCLTALGAKINKVSDGLIVEPIKTPNQNVTLDVGESGSTFRFLLPIVSTLGVTVTFVGAESLKKRPIYPIVNLMKEKGVEFTSDSLPFTVSGKMEAGNYEIDASLSSQFITGLLIAFSLMDEKSTLMAKSLTSKEYVDITVWAMEIFGQKVDNFVVNPTGLKSPNTVVCEGDWSNGAFVLALGLLGGTATCKGLNVDSKQGDKIFVDYARKMGGDISYDKEFTSKKSKLKGATLSVKNCPDLAPILAVLMANAEGESKLTNVDRLRIKECDRLQAIMEFLDKCKVENHYENDVLTIRGGKISPCNLDGKNDHRIAISSIVLLSEVGGTVEGVECMDKSYPNFLQDFEKLGGKYDA